MRMWEINNERSGSMGKQKNEERKNKKKNKEEEHKETNEKKDEMKKIKIKKQEYKISKNINFLFIRNIC